MQWRNRWWPWLSLVAAGLGAFGLWYALRDDSDAVRFETAVVDRGRIVSRVTASGSVSALVTVQVGSQVSGRLHEVLVDFNSKVDKGQLIASIDPQLFQAAREQARANHVAAQANLTRARVQADEARRQFERAAQLAERKLIAQADLDTAQASRESAAAQVEAAAAALEQTRASLNQAEVNLAYTKIHSPISGIVISRNVDVGQTVAASLQAPTLFVIAEDLARMQVHTSVAEADVGRLRDDMPVTFKVDAYPLEGFVGKVRQIRNAPQTVQNVVTYDAVIDVDNPDLKLKPGMTATVTFIVAERDDVLRVNNGALRFRPSPEILASAGVAASAAETGPSGRRERGPTAGREGRKVWRKTVAGLEPVAVDLGLSDGSFTELTGGGLAEGDQVILEVVGEKPAAAGIGGRGMKRMF